MARYKVKIFNKHGELLAHLNPEALVFHLKSSHALIRPDSYPISKVAVSRAKKRKISKVILYVTDTHQKLETTIGQIELCQETIWRIGTVYMARFDIWESTSHQEAML